MVRFGSGQFPKKVARAHIEVRPDSGPTHAHKKSVSGLEFEILYKFEDGHTLAVNCLCSSWAHLVTGGDDGVLNIYNLYSFDWSKCREKRLEVNGRVRCISLADEDDIEQDVAFLFVGTNKGELSVIRLGGYI